MTASSEPDSTSSPRPEKTSQLLRLFAEHLGSGRVSLQDIVASLGDRGLGVLMAIFAVPNIFPAPIPFGNVVFGIPVIILAVHLMMGWPRLKLPHRINKYSVGAAMLKSFAPRLAGMLARIEPLLKPRLPAVSTPAAERVIGLICVILSILSALPIPFGHMVPALALVVIGLGLIEHDGVAILLGAALGLAGVLVFGLVVFGLASGVSHLI
ncbi:MAG: exopolysaccharide biosynthesis protein [Rhizomicrobium sp.]